MKVIETTYDSPGLLHVGDLIYLGHGYMVRGGADVAPYDIEDAKLNRYRKVGVRFEGDRVYAWSHLPMADVREWATPMSDRLESNDAYYPIAWTTIPTHLTKPRQPVILSSETSKFKAQIFPDKVRVHKPNGVVIDVMANSIDFASE